MSAAQAVSVTAPDPDTEFWRAGHGFPVDRTDSAHQHADSDAHQHADGHRHGHPDHAGQLGSGSSGLRAGGRARGGVREHRAAQRPLLRAIRGSHGTGRK